MKITKDVNGRTVEWIYPDDAKAAEQEIKRLRSVLVKIAHTEYGEDGQRQLPSSDELRKWARDALST